MVFIYIMVHTAIKSLWSVRLLMFLGVSSAQSCIYSIKYTEKTLILLQFIILHSYFNICSNVIYFYDAQLYF